MTVHTLTAADKLCFPIGYDWFEHFSRGPRAGSIMVLRFRHLRVGSVVSWMIQQVKVSAAKPDDLGPMLRKKRTEF